MLSLQLSFQKGYPLKPKKVASVDEMPGFDPEPDRKVYLRWYVIVGLCVAFLVSTPITAKTYIGWYKASHLGKHQSSGIEHSPPRAK
jgi:hypothetical protein